MRPGDAGGTQLVVTPEQLHAAAGTLRNVGDGLAQEGDLALSSTEAGNSTLSIALSDFCERARTLATTFVDVVERTGTTVHSAGSSYIDTESANAGAYHYEGPH